MNFPTGLPHEGGGQGGRTGQGGRITSVYLMLSKYKYNVVQVPNTIAAISKYLCLIRICN